MQAITDILRHHSELAVFLTLAGGFVIGKFRVGSFTLGPMLGTLFAGMVIGLLDIPIAPIVKTIFFDLFLFATGYKVGPQFFLRIEERGTASVGPDVCDLHNLSPDCRGDFQTPWI